HVKWIGHLDRLGYHGGKDQAIGTRQIQRGVTNLVPPLLSLFFEPRCGFGTPATRDDVEELACSDIDDLGGELLAPKGPDAGEEHLVEPEGPHHTKTFGVIVHQRGAIGDDGVVDRVPVAPELEGDLVHAAGMSTDLLGDPTPGPVAHRHAGGTDALVLLGPRTNRTGGLGAPPATLVPDEPGRTPKTRQVNQLHR